MIWQIGTNVLKEPAASIFIIVSCSENVSNMFLRNLDISQATSCDIQKDHHKNIHRRENLASRSVTLVQITELQSHLQNGIDISVAFSVPKEFSASDAKCTILLRDS
jgi:hypothetical protein